MIPWEDFPHHLHDLGLGQFSLREANLEGAPELHDLLVSQSLPLQQLSQSVLSQRTPVSTTGLVIFRLRSSLSSSTFLAFRERRCGWTCGISLFIVTESIKVLRFSGMSSSWRLCLDRFFLICTMLGQSSHSHSHPRTITCQLSKPDQTDIKRGKVQKVMTIIKISDSKVLIDNLGNFLLGNYYLLIFNEDHLIVI